MSFSSSGAAGRPLLAVCTAAGANIWSCTREPSSWNAALTLFAAVDTSAKPAVLHSVVPDKGVGFGSPPLPCAAVADWLADSLVVAAVVGHGVGVWQVSRYPLTATFTARIDELDVSAVACNASTGEVALGCRSGSVSVWTTTPPLLHARLGLHDHRSVSCLRWHGAALAATAGSRLSVWSDAHGTYTAHVLQACQSTLTGLAWAYQDMSYVVRVMFLAF